MVSRDVFAGAVVVVVYLAMWGADALGSSLASLIAGRYRRGHTSGVR